MRTAIIALAFAALIASSQAVTFSLAAGASTDTNLNVAGAFGATNPLIATFYSGIKFTNGNTQATITVEPVLQVAFSASLLAAYTSGNVNVGSASAIALKVSADTTGSGTLSITLGSALTGLSAAATQFVLISTPIATVSGSAAEAVYVPPTSSSFEGTSTVSWSISFNRYYAIVALNTGVNVGATVATAFQAAFNTTSRVAANAYTQFSASSNARSSTNTNVGSAAGSTTSGGNAFVQFASTSDAQLKVDQYFFGGSSSGKTYVAPSGTNANIGLQFSITKSAGAFNGNLTFNSNGKSFDSSRASAYSWFKASTGTATSSGWAKVSSTSSVDANGNLIVTAQQSGDFSEWTVAASPASTVAAGILAVVAALAILF